MTYTRADAKAYCSRLSCPDTHVLTTVPCRFYADGSMIFVDDCHTCNEHSMVLATDAVCDDEATH